nr:phospholipase D-like domain-containing protein [uncultured Bdellovibrio sp.]
MKKQIGFLFCAVFALNSCTTVTPSSTREPNSFLSGMDLITQKELDKFSSTKDLRLSDTEVLADNDDAFESKIRMIRAAKAGETIRLVYYIYSHDHSSSVMTEELLKATARGVKVRILLDFFVNYKTLDELLLMQKLGKGNLEVRFYGKPTDLMIRDARFLTMPCAKKDAKSKASDCSDAKWAQIKTGNAKDADIYARLLLSAIYAQNLDLLKLAIMGGQELDLKTFSVSHRWSNSQKRNVAAAADVDLESIFKNLKLLKENKIDGNYIARLKIALGMVFMGSTLNPILYEVYGRVPLDQPKPHSWNDWLHFTDYTHHKMILLEDRMVQLGGRNIENSYHMKKNHLTDKYIFRDTDLFANITRGGRDIANAYDRLWNYKPMVWTANDAYSFMPHDWVVNTDWLKQSLESCKSQMGKNRSALASCLSNRVSANSFTVQQDRQTRIEKEWQQKADTFYREYVRKPSDKHFKISDSDAQKMAAYYVENLPFSFVDKDQSNQDRIYGASKRSWAPWGEDREELNGKNIHAAWMKELENVCEVSRTTGKSQRVIFHSAYYMPPANLVRAFGKMLDGRWNCKNVKVTFITNSEQSTDLFFMNVFAKYQLRAFFDVYRRKNKSAPTFEYLEYKGTDDKGGKLSLHSKVSVFGDDVLIGSANLDVRSFYMDTNNGMLLRNVPQFAREYTEWVDDLIRNSGLLENKTDLYIRGEGIQSMRNRDWQMAKAQLAKINPKLVEGKNGEFIKKLIFNLSERIYQLSLQLVDYNQVPVQSNDRPDESNEQKSKQQMLETEYDELLQLI